MHPEEARAALDQISETDAKLAAKIKECPPWRHALFGGIFMLLIGSIAVSSAAQVMTTPFILLAIFLTVRSDRKRFGVFINGYRRGATLPVSLFYVAVMVCLVVAAMHMRDQEFSNPSKFALSVLALGLGVAFSIVWNRIFQRELGAM